MTDDNWTPWRQGLIYFRKSDFNFHSACVYIFHRTIFGGQPIMLDFEFMMDVMDGCVKDKAMVCRLAVWVTCERPFNVICNILLFAAIFVGFQVVHFSFCVSEVVPSVVIFLFSFWTFHLQYNKFNIKLSVRVTKQIIFSPEKAKRSHTPINPAPLCFYYLLFCIYVSTTQTFPVKFLWSNRCKSDRII